jgi:flagellar L-ring protein precursor FlgH
MRIPIFSLFALTGLCITTCSADSLWTAPGSIERSSCADHKASAVGDIVTIVISEDVSQSSTSSKKTSTDGSVDASVTQFLFPTSASKLGTHNGSLPATTFGGKSGYAGSGSVDNKQSVSARAAVLVTDVLPNGNLVIEGVRKVKFSGETQHIVLHGVIRCDDISPSNTISSASIAQARLEFISEGDLADASKRGWLNKLYEVIRPF